MTTVVVGVDPGAEHTGIVLLHTGELTGDVTLRAHRTIHQDAHRRWLPVSEEYLLEVQRAVENMVWPAEDMTRLVVGVEMLHPPVFAPAAGLTRIDPGPLVATAIVAGYTLGRWAGAAVTYQVPPGRNGKGPYGSYPGVLVTAQERTQPGWETRPAGQGKLRHERSALDVARVAERMDRPHRRQG